MKTKRILLITFLTILALATFTQANVNDSIINNISLAIHSETSGHFPIRVQNYESAELDEYYTPHMTITFINTSNLINEEMDAMRNSSYLQRIYYDNNKTAAYLWFTDILQQLRSGINTDTTYSNLRIGELNNGDTIVCNNASNTVNITFDYNDIYDKLDIWDLTSHRPVEFNNTGNVMVQDIAAQSAHIVYAINLSKIEITNGNYLLYSDQKSGISSTDQINFIDDPVNGSWDFFQSQTYSHYDWKMQLNDPSYVNMDFYVYYGSVNQTGVDNTSIYSAAIIVGDEDDTGNDGTFDDSGALTRIINDNNNFYGYIAVDDYCNPTNWQEPERKAWIVTKQKLIESWTNVSDDVKIFLDGYDIGDAANCDNASITALFFDSVRNITDYIHNTKNTTVIFNTYTAYLDVLGLADGIMKESCISRWNGTTDNPTYSYENWTLEVERHNNYKSFGVPVFCQAFGNESDYEMAYYDYMAGVGILGYEHFSYNQPKFWYNYWTPGSGENWNLHKFPDLGEALESDFTQTDDVYERRWEYGIVRINTTSHTAELVNDLSVQNMQLHMIVEDFSDTVGHEGNIICELNGNSSLRTNVSEYNIPVGHSQVLNISLNKTLFYNKEGYYNWVCWYDCESDSCLANTPSKIYYSFNRSVNGGRNSWLDETNNGHPPSGTGAWTLHPGSWAFDWDYTYYGAPKEWKWHNWQMWMTMDQQQYAVVDNPVGISRSDSGTSVRTITISALDDYSIPIHDSQVFINKTPTAFSNIITTDGTVLNVSYDSSCISDIPTYNNTYDSSGYLWQACRYEYLDGYAVKVILPHLSEQNYTINNNPPTIPTLLTPVTGTYMTTVSINCSGSTVENGSVYYNIDAYFNASNTTGVKTWQNLVTQDADGLYIWYFNLSGVPAQTDVDLRCNATDTEQSSAYYNPSGNITLETNLAPNITYYNMTPLAPTKDDDFIIWATCEDADVNDTLTAYVNVFRNTVNYTAVQSKLVVNGTRTNFYNITSSWTDENDTWVAEIWCGDGTSITTKYNVSRFIPDITDPAVSITLNDTSLLFGNDSIKITWTASDEFLDCTEFNISYPNETILSQLINIQNGDINLSPSNLTITGTYTVRLYANDSNGNENYTLSTFTVYVPGAAAEDSNLSLVLNAVMAVLILGAVVIPAGLIIAAIQGEFNPTLMIAGVITVIGLGILIMMFYFIKAALITASG